MSAKCGYANGSLITSNKWELREAGTRFSCAFITTLCSVAALLAPCPASGAETIYLSNSSGNRIEMYDASTGADLGVFASTGLNAPSGLAFDSAGNLYVANYNANAIMKFRTIGLGSVFATNGLDGPQGLAFDSVGNLYVANKNSYTIEKFTTNGISSVFASTTGSGRPYALAFDSAGNLYVDEDSGRIQKFTTNGVGSAFTSIPCYELHGLAFDGTGNLYVAVYYYNSTIQKFTPEAVGSQMDFALLDPIGLAFDSSGILYMSDQAGIKKYAPDSTYLGSFSTGQNGAGMIAIRVGSPPLVAVCSSNITVTATGPSGATVFYATTNAGGCSGTSISRSPPSGSTFPIGTTTVSCLATDSCGQSDLCSFTVTVVEPPLLAICPPNIRVAATTLSGATVFYTPSTSGGCIGASVTYNPPSGSLFPIGTTTVSCLATDACGQTDTCAFTVTARLAATNTVTSLADSGPGSLRQVIADSDLGDRIVFNVSGTITLASPLSISTNLVLDGGNRNVTISGNNSVRLVYVATNVSLTILNLGLANGLSTNGGALFNAGGSVNATNCVFTGNRAAGPNGSTSAPDGIIGAGGAVYNAGSFVASQCTFVLNAAQGGRGADGNPVAVAQPPPAGKGGWGEGGAFCNLGLATFERSLFASNSAVGGSGGVGSAANYYWYQSSWSTPGGQGGAGAGGALYNAGAATLVNCTLACNSGTGGNGGAGGSLVGPMPPCRFGVPGGNGGAGIGGIYSTNGLLIMTNCTAASNFASGGTGASGGSSAVALGYGGSGGVAVGGMSVQLAPAILINAIVASNSSIGGSGGYGCRDTGVSVVCSNSANGASLADCSGSVFDLGHNLSSDWCFTNATSFNQTDPKLGPLANNGGPTLTLALLPGSPAIDAGDTSAAPATDQRAFPRPAGLAADIGAYELCYPPILRVSEPQAGAISIRAYGTNGQACRLLSSPDLSSWVSLATNQIGSEGTTLFYDTCAPGAACRFYRLVMP